MSNRNPWNVSMWDKPCPFCQGNASFQLPLAVPDRRYCNGCKTLYAPSSGLAIQPLAVSVPLDGHRHAPGEYCRGCHELRGTYDPKTDPRRQTQPARPPYLPGFVYESHSGKIVPHRLNDYAVRDAMVLALSAELAHRFNLSLQVDDLLDIVAAMRAAAGVAVGFPVI